jgi:hypothetical protein
MPEFSAEAVAIMPGPWVPVVGGVGYQNSWADSGHGDPGAYRIQPLTNQVEIIADLSVPTFSSDSVIFQLPVGFRPASIQSFQAIIIASTGTVGVTTPRIYVAASNGNVTAANASIPGAASGLTTRMAIHCLVSLDF